MHTKEDWRLNQDLNDSMGMIFILGENREFVCDIENESNAKRIVACVNACKGIPTEELEKGIIEDMIGVIDITATVSYRIDYAIDGAKNILNRLGNNG
jgi:hypothetical protein